MPRNLKLGTRKSLLAWAQSSLIAEELMQKHPGLHVELVGIVTRGDQITDIPLSKIEGKEFFVKEIDDALREKRVDFTVHSLKDLSLDRPKELCLGALPRREDPRDIIVFSESVTDKLKEGREVLIGTSSPRRLQNIPDFLYQALPQGSTPPKLKFVEIRGNVNTRLQRLRDAGERQLDGVVLALAGLSRLSKHPSSKSDLHQLLQGTKFMVLPLTHSPTAPGQGALAIECRSDDAEVLAILKTIHDAPSAEAVGNERKLMAAWGGGCHQRFGISSVQQKELGTLIFKRGIIADGTVVDDVEFAHTANAEKGHVVDGMAFRASREVVPLDFRLVEGADAVFLASGAAATPNLLTSLRKKRLWCVGPGSWFKLARLGLWVEGCADGLGVDYIVPTMQVGVLDLPKLDQWVVLTHADAKDTWSFGKVFAPYKIKYEFSEIQKQNLRDAKHIFWSSGSQFLSLRQYTSKDVVHSCGAGKTAAVLRKENIKDVHVFPSHASWKKWIQQGTES